MAEERFTPEQLIEALHEHHGVKIRAAKALGCSRMTVENYVKRYDDVRDAVLDAREGMKDIAEDSLHKKVEEGEAWAVCFYLKTQAKDRGYVERQEVAPTDPTGQPLDLAGLVLLARDGRR